MKSGKEGKKDMSSRCASNRIKIQSKVISNKISQSYTDSASKCTTSDHNPCMWKTIRKILPVAELVIFLMRPRKMDCNSCKTDSQEN